MIKKVSTLIFLLSLCMGFIFYVGPFLDTLEVNKPLVNFIEENDIDAGALYYTEIEEFSDANINMENTRDYTPRGPVSN